MKLCYSKPTDLQLTKFLQKDSILVSFLRFFIAAILERIHVQLLKSHL